MFACPNSSWTYFGCTLRLSSSVAQVCRRSWKRIGGTPARFRSGANDRSRRLLGFIGVPTSLAKTRPWSGCSPRRRRTLPGSHAPQSTPTLPQLAVRLRPNCGPQERSSTRISLRTGACPAGQTPWARSPQPAARRALRPTTGRGGWRALRGSARPAAGGILRGEPYEPRVEQPHGQGARLLGGSGRCCLHCRRAPSLKKRVILLIPNSRE